jgi:hypothetical protein
MGGILSVQMLLLSRLLQSSIQTIALWIARHPKGGRGTDSSDPSTDITQDQLADLSRLNRVHLYRLETGRQSMTLRTLKLIADSLGVRVRDLVGDL